MYRDLDFALRNECFCELDRIEEARMTAFEIAEKRYIAGLMKLHQLPP